MSVFGELVINFMPKLIRGFGTYERKKQCLGRLFKFFDHCNSRIAVLYMMMGVELFASSEVLHEERGYLGPQELSSIRNLIDGDRAVTIWTLADRSTLYWDDIRLTMAILAEPRAYKRHSVDYLMARDLCVKGFSSDLPRTAQVWLKESVRDAIALFIELPADTSYDAQIRYARSISLMATFLLRQDDGNPNGLKEALVPLDSRLIRLRTGSVYASEGLVERCIILTNQLLSRFKECDEGLNIEYEWESFPQQRDEVFDVVKEELFALKGMPFDMIEEYCHLLKALLDMPSESSLIGRLLDLWDVSWETLEPKSDGQASVFADEARKFSSFKVMEIVLAKATEISFFRLSRCDKDALKFLFVECGLQRSLNSNEERNTNWSELQHFYQNAQFDCIRSLNKYLTASSTKDGKSSGEVAKLAFSLCLEGLSDASYFTGPCMFRLASALLNEDWKIEKEDVETITRVGKFLVEENWNNAKFFIDIVREFATTIFHRCVLATDFGDDGNAEVEKAFAIFFDWGELKMPIVPSMAKSCLDFWSKAISDDPKDQNEKGIALKSLKRLKSMFIRLLLFGPLWDLNKDQRRLDASISLKVREMDKLSSKGNAGIDFEEVQGRLQRFDKKAHIVCSYLLMALHIGRHIPADDQKIFFPQAFDCLMPWITTNHFSIRLYAQYAVHQCWKMCNSPTSPSYLREIAAASPIALAADFLEQNPDCVKHRQKADKMYFLSEAFDPVRDVTIDFIFHGAMIVADVTEEERISSQAFHRINPSPGRKLPLNHDSNRRALWIPGGTEAQPTRADGLEQSVQVDAPLQRKIVPWETMMMTDIDVSQAREEHLKKTRNTLIVVATLVSKPPNLGGLCRTCEIFNAELLVLGNIKVKDDPTFQSTSVTADKWMPFLEVREPDLVSYLLRKKEEGYSILGIEQATTSVSLEKFEFPKQSVLVLGKEREGIPAHIMPVLDYILEIPQLGIIRSLNVHVSGALIIWEYSRQLAIKN
ncbi:Tar (HIV-1) RNA binding protein 1 [Dinochytrium kinnereticum]|nr:Tar (HIV-1) RNA binding protein 1 [Dinochytrium kinnereticum]